MAPTSKTTFPLYGYERFHAKAPGSSARLAHVVSLRGDVSTLASVLPQAVVATFNQFPRLRASVLPGTTQQKAMIGAPLVDAAELSDHLYSLSWLDHEQDSSEWMAWVERQCNTPVDRERTWPYAVHVRADKTTQRFARLVVLADAYMADTTACALVANAVLAHAARLSSGEEEEEERTEGEEPPLSPSLYETMHSVHPVAGIFGEAVSKWVLQPLFNFDHAGFTPALPVDASTEQDGNSQSPSHALFATGTAANMKLAIDRCVQERVSLRGVTTAATMMAIALAQHHGSLAGTAHLSLKLDAELDMREGGRTGQVGLYSLPGSLVFTSSHGVAVGSSFWELARRCDLEWDVARHGHELSLQSLFVHETLAVTSSSSHHSVVSDARVSVSNRGPLPQEITLYTKVGAATTLHVETAHSLAVQPWLSATCGVHVDVATSFNYALASKLQGDAAAETFHWLVQIMEHVGSFEPGDSLLQASEKLPRRHGQAPVSPMPSVAV